MEQSRSDSLMVIGPQGFGEFGTWRESMIFKTMMTAFARSEKKTGWLNFLLNPMDPNGMGLHVWLGIPAFFISMLDPVLLNVRPHFEVLGFIYVPCIIGPYALAFASIDKGEEQLPLTFLMGGFSSAVLSFAGVAVGMGIASAYEIKITEGSVYCFSMGWAIFMGLAVYFSYGTIGAMSRDYRDDGFAAMRLSSPMSIQAAISSMVRNEKLKLRDRLEKALYGMGDDDLDQIVVDRELGPIALEVLAFFRLPTVQFAFIDELERDLRDYRRIIKSIVDSGTYVDRARQHGLAREQMIARVRSHKTSRGRNPFRKS